MIVVMRHDGYLTPNVAINLLICFDTFLDEQKGVEQSEDFRSSHSDDDSNHRSEGNDPMILS